MTFEYEADNDDELTIRVGDVVEIITKDVDQQEGWWEVRVCVRVCVLVCMHVVTSVDHSLMRCLISKSVYRHDIQFWD